VTDPQKKTNHKTRHSHCGLPLGAGGSSSPSLGFDSSSSSLGGTRSLFATILSTSNSCSGSSFADGGAGRFFDFFGGAFAGGCFAGAGGFGGGFFLGDFARGFEAAVEVEAEAEGFEDEDEEGAGTDAEAEGLEDKGGAETEAEGERLEEEGGAETRSEADEGLPLVLRAGRISDCPEPESESESEIVKDACFRGLDCAEDELDSTGGFFGTFGVGANAGAEGWQAAGCGGVDVREGPFGRLGALVDLGAGAGGETAERNGPLIATVLVTGVAWPTILGSRELEPRMTASSDWFPVFPSSVFAFFAGLASASSSSESSRQTTPFFSGYLLSMTFAGFDMLGRTRISVDFRAIFIPWIQRSSFPSYLVVSKTPEGETVVTHRSSRPSNASCCRRVDFENSSWRIDFPA